jgi:hypothetical protein
VLSDDVAPCNVIAAPVHAKFRCTISVSKTPAHAAPVAFDKHIQTLRSARVTSSFAFTSAPFVAHTPRALATLRTIWPSYCTRSSVMRRIEGEAHEKNRFM